MVNETDVSKEINWFYEKRASIAVTNLIKRRINAQYVPSRLEAFSTIMEMIPIGATVSRGDSVTLEQIGLIDELKKCKKYKFIDPFLRTDDGSYALDLEERLRMQRGAFTVDVFLTGTNAVTLDGKLVNIDGLGNRVAPLIFGPRKVIIVVGANKIVKDVTTALDRIHNVSSQLNHQRHYLKHNMPEVANLPCFKTGMCCDCFHERKSCLITVIIEGTYYRVKGRMNVVLVGEELGL
jgi:hypothetical protein